MARNVILLIIIGLAVITFAGRKLPGFSISPSPAEQAENPVLAAYTERLQKTKDPAYILVRKGIRLLEAGQLTLATLTFKRATEIDPKYRDAAYYWGFSLTEEGKWQEAKTALEQAAKIDPIHNPTIKLLCTTYEKLELEQEKENCYARIKEIEKAS